MMACLALAGSAGAEGGGWSWRQTLTPHFAIKHQSAWLPPGFTMGAERVYFRLKMDLNVFSPWMSKEKVNLFVYSDHESYLAGEFRPPAWSNGLAIYERKAVALPSMKDPRKLLAVMAHETTHLLFESYWREGRRQSPAWINEGLAMLQEADSPDKPETSGWYQQMTLIDAKRFPPLTAFFAVTPTKDLHNDQAAVGEWYIQAYSVTHFLLRKHSRLQFKSFCGYLRDGKPAAEALWLAYRYRSVRDFDKKWRSWLADPAHKRRVASLAADARRGVDDGTVNKAGRTKASFKPFATGFKTQFQKRLDGQ